MRRAAQHQSGKIAVAPGAHNDDPGTEIPGLPDNLPAACPNGVFRASPLAVIPACASAATARSAVVRASSPVS